MKLDPTAEADLDLTPDTPAGHVDTWVTLESDMKRPAVQKAAKTLKKAAEKSRKKKKPEKEKLNDKENSSPLINKSDDFIDKSKLNIPKLDSFNQSSVDSGTSCDSSDRRKKSPLLQPKWTAQRANSDTGLGCPNPSNSSLMTPPTEDLSRSTLKPAQSEELWPGSEANNHTMLRNGSIPHSSVNVCDPKLTPTQGKKPDVPKRPIISSIDKFLHTRRRNRYKHKHFEQFFSHFRRLPDLGKKIAISPFSKFFLLIFLVETVDFSQKLI